MADPFKDTRDPLIRSMERNAIARLTEERDRYREALQRLCDPNKCHWTAAAMFRVAEAALNGSTVDGDGKS